jgi:maltose O-acetyltransferase
MSFIKRRWRGFMVWIANTFFKGTHFFALKRGLFRCAGIKVGKKTKIVGPVFFGNCSKIRIGDYCWIGTKFCVYGDGEVVIGDNCDIAPEVAFFTGSHEIGDATRRAGNGKLFRIEVKSGCWICARVSITGNTVIERSSVVGACSFVNKDVGDNCVVAGVPAQRIKGLD